MSRAVLASLLVLSLAAGVRDTLAPSAFASAALRVDVAAPGEAVATLNAPGLL